MGEPVVACLVGTLVPFWASPKESCANIDAETDFRRTQRAQNEPTSQHATPLHTRTDDASAPRGSAHHRSRFVHGKVVLRKRRPGLCVVVTSVSVADESPVVTMVSRADGTTLVRTQRPSSAPTASTATNVRRGRLVEVVEVASDLSDEVNESRIRRFHVSLQYLKHLHHLNARVRAVVRGRY